MLQAIVVTQGRLAHELLNSAERVVGKPIRARSVCLHWEASAEEDRQALSAVLEDFAPDDQLLILTDLPGGTPYRVALSLADERTEVITGVNLAMVVRLGCLSAEDPRSVGDIATWLAHKGRGAVTAAADHDTDD